MAFTGFETWVADGKQKSPLEFGMDVSDPLYVKAIVKPSRVIESKRTPVTNYKIGHGANVQKNTPVDCSQITFERVALDFVSTSLDEQLALARCFSQVELNSQQGMLDGYLTTMIQDMTDVLDEEFELLNIRDLTVGKNPTDESTGGTELTSATLDAKNVYSELLNMIQHQLAQGSKKENLKIYVASYVYGLLANNTDNFMISSDISAEEMRSGISLKVDGVPLVIAYAIEKFNTGTESAPAYDLQAIIVDMSRWIQYKNTTDGELKAVKMGLESGRWNSVAIAGRTWFGNYIKRTWSLDLSTSNKNASAYLKKVTV